jgi:peptide/nickel transport system substrate-binding protein
LDRAEELLDEAGWGDSDGDGIRDGQVNGQTTPFEFTMLVRQGDPLRLRVCELMKFNLDQIGIVCNITPLEATVLQQRMLDRNFEGSFGGWGAGADPDTSDNLWVTGQNRNYANYSNPEVDRLFADGRRELDRDKRGAIYARIGEQIYADQPYTFLYYRNAFYGFNQRLRGYNFSPRGPYHYGPGIGSIYKPVE